MRQRLKSALPDALANRVQPASQQVFVGFEKYLKVRVYGSRTCKPNSVCRCRQDDHSSGPCITARLKRPTRRFCAPSRHAPAVAAKSSCSHLAAWSPCTMKTLQRRRNFLPIWSCSVWGLPCPHDYSYGGALLPHLFTLTRALRPGRYILCGTFRRAGLNRPSRTLSGTLLCGVRTFLCLATAIVRSGCQPLHYIAGDSAGGRLVS